MQRAPPHSWFFCFCYNAFIHILSKLRGLSGFRNFTVCLPLPGFVSLSKHNVFNLGIKLPICLIFQCCHTPTTAENTFLCMFVSMYLSTAKTWACATEGWSWCCTLRRGSLWREQRTVMKLIRVGEVALQSNVLPDCGICLHSASAC